MLYRPPRDRGRCGVPPVPPWFSPCPDMDPGAVTSEVTGLSLQLSGLSRRSAQLVELPGLAALDPGGQLGAAEEQHACPSRVVQPGRGHSSRGSRGCLSERRRVGEMACSCFRSLSGGSCMRSGRVRGPPGAELPVGMRWWCPWRNILRIVTPRHDRDTLRIPAECLHDPVFGAAPVDQFVGCVEQLATHAVQPGNRRTKD